MIAYAEGVELHSPGSPDEGGLPWVMRTTRDSYPEGVPRRAHEFATLWNPVRGSPFVFGAAPGFRGFAAEPWAAEFNAFGVNAFPPRLE